MVSNKLLFEYGFLNEEGKKLFGELKQADRKKLLKTLDNFKDYVNEEKMELHSTIFGNKPVNTGYPKPASAHRLIYENYSMSIEEMYFWVLTQLTVDQGFPKDKVVKITDIFSASEMSSYWGISAQRLSIQQDRASQYLKFIADMIKTMFQLIRDLNIVDEKLGYYASSFNENDNVAQDGEIVLKGQYTDLVEGGPKNPSSVFGMAQQLGFATLPNLFFQTRIKGKTEEDIINKIHDRVFKMDFGNDTFKTVLERKLSSFYRWKFRTYKQLKTYRKLYKSYLKQHYNNIRLYMNWVKPYLRNIRKLSPDSRKGDSADLISAFEGEMIEIEILANKKVGDAYSVVLANFDYRTMPQMEWVPGHQERRAIMTGRAEMNIKAYAWTEEQFENYKKMKAAEDLELLKEIDETIKESMEALEGDVKKYLEEKEEGQEKEEEKKEEPPKKWKVKKGKIVEVEDEETPGLKPESVFEPFKQVFKGAELLVKPFSFRIPLFKKKYESGDDFDNAKNIAKNAAWNTYKFYKKAHGLLSW